MALRALGWGYAAFPHPLPSGVASYVARNCCKRLRLATASTYENFSPRRAHEGLCDPGNRRGHDHQDPSGHNRDEEPRARSLRLSSQPDIYPVPQDVVSTGLTKGGYHPRVSRALGPGLCRILDMDFVEFPFHALR